MNTPSPPPLRLSWFIWSLGALLYLMGYFHRVAPAVMTTELMREYQISAAALGNLSAYYFYSYVAMQIPTGIIADLWGPRRLLSTGAGVAALGTILFALAPTMVWAGLGRFLIGGSVAVAFVGLLKLSSAWFPARYYAMVSGMAVFCGIIGAVFAGTPLRLLMNQGSWRTIMLAVAGVTLVIGVVIRLFLRDYPQEQGYRNYSSEAPSEGRLSAGLAEVLRYRNTLLLLVIPAAFAGTVITFCGLWGVPYLTTHHGLSPSQAALLTSALMIVMAIGGPLFGWFSDRLRNRKGIFIAGAAVTLAGWSVALLVKDLSFHMLVLALLVGSFSSSCMILTFAMAKESVPIRLSGTISGVINMGVMSGPMLMQPAVGWVLDHRWQGRMAGGVRLYGLEAYQAGFAIMLIWMALALVLLFFTRETHCRQMA